MSDHWRNNERDQFSLPLTPMIDVVFLLLIFFLTSTALKPDMPAEERVKLDLPQSKEAIRASGPDANEITLVINASGAMRLSTIEGRVVSLDDVRAELSRLRQEGYRSFALRADKNCRFSLPADVIRIASDIGLTIRVGYQNAESPGGASR